MWIVNASSVTKHSGKTEVLWIGALSNNEQVLFPERNLKWAKDSVKALGVWFSVNSTKSLALNYKEKTEKIRNITENWAVRRLTMFGKITIIKAFLVSQLVYILTPLPTHHSALKDINTSLYKFLWDGKGDKIKRSIMINDYKEGGARMIDIVTLNQSLKITWIKKYVDLSNNGKCIYHGLRNLIFGCL